MIITISREFGSGGHELGKLLAEELGIPCYDREIIGMLTEESGLEEAYVEETSERGIQAAYPMAVGRRFSVPLASDDAAISIAVGQRKIIEELGAKGDCIIVGRGADVILEGLRPLRIFVYADRDSKLKRCIERAPEGEGLSAAQMERKMKQIDKARSRNHDLHSGTPWGRKESYDLCVNSSGKDIGDLVPGIAAYARAWFGA